MKGHTSMVDQIRLVIIEIGIGVGTNLGTIMVKCIPIPTLDETTIIFGIAYLTIFGIKIIIKTLGHKIDD